MCSQWAYNYQVRPIRPMRPSSFEVCQAILLQLKSLPESDMLKHFFNRLEDEAKQQTKIEPISSNLSNWCTGLSRMYQNVSKFVNDHSAEIPPKPPMVTSNDAPVVQPSELQSFPLDAPARFTL